MVQELTLQLPTSESNQIVNNFVLGAEDGLSVEKINNYIANCYKITGNTLKSNKNGFWLSLSNSIISNNIATLNKISGLDIEGKFNTIQFNNLTYNGVCGLTL